jgi:ferredoxin
MFAQLLTLGTGNTKAPPLFQRSRCLRMRRRDNSCARCLDVCPSQALDFTSSEVINEAACSSCYQCTAACPTDGLVVGDFDFHRYLRELDVHEPLVIGCELSRAGIRSALPCLGMLSHIHLTVLLLLGKKIEIDVSPCQQCGAGLVAPALTKRLEWLRTGLPSLPGDRITLQTKTEVLSQPSRRDFFAALKSSFIQQASTLVPKTGKAPVTYSEKSLPRQRKLLNDSLRAIGKEEGQAVAGAFYFHLDVTEDCDLCFTCVAACPTGALRKKKSEEGKGLLFQSSSCSGCNLCTEYCRRKAIRIGTGGRLSEIFIWQNIHHSP